MMPTRAGETAFKIVEFVLSGVVEAHHEQEANQWMPQFIGKGAAFVGADEGLSRYGFAVPLR